MRVVEKFSKVLGDARSDVVRYRHQREEVVQHDES